MVISRDRVTGAVLILAGIAVFAGARGFMTPAGLTYGAGFFPKIIAIGMGISGLLILIGDLRGASSEVARIDARSVARILALMGMILVYGLALDPVGFLPSTAVLIFAVALFYGARLLAAVALALIATIILHLVFYSLMKVSLPWGILEPWAW
jgi:hypothetical protein